MKCQFCSNPATVHFTNIVNKTKRELNLCESCAKEKNLIGDASDLKIAAVVQFAVDQLSTPQKALPDEMVCPQCGIPYSVFRAHGRLGCPHDYEMFRMLLEPLLQRIQDDGARHVGKVPGRHRRRRRAARKAQMQASLVAAVSAERYEEAAKLRDQIRSLGADNEP